MNSTHYLDLFEALRQSVEGVSLDDFGEASRQGRLPHFQFWDAVANTPLAPLWGEVANLRNAAAAEAMPRSVREKAFADLKYKISDTLGSLRAGAVLLPRRRLKSDVINKISDAKVRTICLEINSTPDGNVISLLQLLGEALKWTLWFRANQVGTTLKESGGLQDLLNEAVAKKYFKSNAANRFLKDFKDHFVKASFDMVRHSATYVPDLTVVNPQFEALEVILDESF
jgi:hypothetical protein